MAVRDADLHFKVDQGTGGYLAPDGTTRPRSRTKEDAMTANKKTRESVCQCESYLVVAESAIERVRVELNRVRCCARSTIRRVLGARHREATQDSAMLSLGSPRSRISAGTDMRGYVSGASRCSMFWPLSTMCASQRSHGATRCFLDRASRERLAVEMPAALQSFVKLDTQVAIADDGSLITAAHRTQRIRRDIQRRRTLAIND